MPIHNQINKMDTALKNLEKLDISDNNKRDIKDFLHYIASNDCSVTRQVKYIYILPKIARWLDKDFKSAQKQDIQYLVEYVNTAKKGNGEPKGITELRKYIDKNKGNNQESRYTKWTQSDYRIIIKKFWKWLYNRHKDDEDEWETPKLVKFIKPKKPRESNKIPSDLLNNKDVELLLKHCRTLREKALILVLYESGARIGEILNLKIKDTSFTADGVHLNLFGKTGYRRILLIGSAPALTQWITQEHPAKNNRDSYLFCNINRGTEGAQLSYASVKNILKTLKEKSGFQKPINPHHWRHSRATELAEHLTDAQRCQYLGWVQGSDMARIYTHLADTDRVILELNDLVPKEKQNGKFTSVTCPRCGTVNPFGSEDCSKCFLSLESQEAKEEVSLRRKIKVLEKYQNMWREELEKIMPEFWDMKQRLDRIDEQQSDLEIKERWREESNKHYIEQEKLHKKLSS